MFLKFQYLLPFLFVFISVSQASVFGPDPISLGETKSLYFNPPLNPGHVFLVNLTTKLPNEDLTILTFPSTPSSHPLLILSNRLINVTNFNESDLELQGSIFAKCFGRGVEICSVPEANLTSGSLVYVTVMCEEKCYFQLQVNYHEEKVFPVDRLVLINFVDKTSQVLKINIPPQNITYDHLLINAKLLNPYAVQLPFHIYINQGNMVPSSDAHDYKVETTWEEGKGISISREPNDDMKPLCFDCNFTLVMEADVHSQIRLKSQLVSSVREIKLGEQIHDIVNFEQNRTYIIKTTPGLMGIFNQESLQFRLKPFSGHCILYISFDNFPTSFDFYHYKISGRHEEDFVLTPEDRRKLFPSFQNIYLSVYGETDAAFQITVTPYLDSLRHADFGVVETGVLAYKEVINYHFEIIDVNMMNLTIDLINEVGRSDIMLKYCLNNIAQCNFKYEDYLKINSSNMIFKTENKESKLHLKFHHEFNKCRVTESRSDEGFLNKIIHWIKNLIYPRQADNKCHYAIGVVANNSLFQLNRYSLLLNYEKKMNILREQSVIRSSLNLDNYDDFVFTALNDPTIEKITFQFTCISGEISAFSTRNSTANDTFFQKRTEFDYDSIEYTRDKTDETMAGRYHVRVYANSSAYYTLMTLVARNHRFQPNETSHHQNNTNLNITNNTNNESKLNYSVYEAIKLYNGLTQKISYRSNFSYPNYFQVSLNYSTEELKNVIEVFHLSVNPIKGKFMIFLGLDFVPNIDKYTWSSFNNSISILGSDPKFKNPAIIYIMVRNFHATNLENYEYLITFSYNSTVVDMLLGVPLHIFFMGGDVRHYSFNLDAAKAVDFIFSKSVNGIHSDSIRVFISTNRSNIYPNENNFDLEMNDSSLNISEANKKQICQNAIHFCPLYITVKAYENADFTLAVRTKDSITLLSDGEPIVLPIPQNGDHPYKLYFNPPKDHTISISTYSIYQKTSIFVNIIPLNSDSATKDSWIFPSNTSYQHSSLNHSSFDSTSLVLHESYFKENKCDEIPSGCIVTIRVYPHHMPEYLAYLSNPYFSIVVSSEIIKLTPNVAHIGSVKDKAYKYFSVYANENDTIFISLTPLTSGDPDLVVSFGQESRPTLDDNTWVLRTFGGENLEISPAELNNKVGKKLPGYYVVGVFGFKNCTFSLSVMVGELKFMKIYNGSPLQMRLKPKETIYLEYFHYIKLQGFKVLIVEETGEVDIYINSKELNVSYVDSLPRVGNTSTYKWNNLNQIHKNLLSVSNSDPQFCNLCRYFIALHSHKPAKMTVLIGSSNTFISLQSGKTLHDWLLPNDVNKYTVFSNTGNLEIIVVAYSGDPVVSVSKSYGDKAGNVIQQSEKREDSKLINLKIFSDDNIKKGGRVGISYSILVNSSNNKEANYSIMAVTLFQEKYLKYGALDFTSLGTGDSQLFVFSGTFNETLKEINQTLTISIAFSNIEESHADSILKNQFEYFYPIVTFEILGLDSRETRKGEVLKEHFSGKLANYVVKTENSKFRMNITNPSNETMNFTIMINNVNFNTILPNSENFGLVPMNSSDNYEILSSKKGLLLIEVFECSGKLQLLSTDKYDNAVKRDFEGRTVNNIDNHLILARKPESNYLFFSLSPYEVDSKAIRKFTDFLDINKTKTYNEAYYKLSSMQLSPDSSSPYQRFFYNQQTKWLFTDALLQISFETIRNNEDPSKTPEYQVIEYLYALYISDDIEILESVVQCNSPLNSNRSKHTYISMNYASLYYNETTHPTQANFNLNVSALVNKVFGDGEFHSRSLYFGIQAKVLVKGHENFLTLTFIYEQNQIYLSRLVSLGPETKESSNKVLYICLSIVGVAIVALGLVFCRRYMIIKKRLEFEVYTSKNEEIIDQTHENQTHRKDYQGFSDEKNQTEV